MLAYYNDQKEYLYEPFFEGLPTNSIRTLAANSMHQSYKRNENGPEK